MRSDGPGSGGEERPQAGGLVLGGRGDRRSLQGPTSLCLSVYRGFKEAHQGRLPPVVEELPCADRKMQCILESDVRGLFDLGFLGTCLKAL